MANQEGHQNEEKKPIDGGWVLLLFAVLLLGILVLGFLFH
jgi:hypothetical protein